MRAVQRKPGIPPRAPSRARGVGSGWNTLRLLRGFRTLLLCLDLILLLSALNVLEQEQSDLRVIGAQEAPALSAAYGLAHSLQALQLAFMTEWLQGSPAMTNSRQDYEEKRSDTIRNMLHTSQESSKDPRTEAALETIALDLGTYERLVTRSQELQRSDTAAAHSSFNEAFRYMQGSILPAANAMEDTEIATLHDLRRRETSGWVRAQSMLFLPCALMAAALLWAQIFLSHRTRRTLNLPLVAATLLILLAEAQLYRRASEVHRGLQVAREDSLASSERLWQMRQAAFAAAAYEEQWLSNPADGEGAQAAWASEAASIASKPEGLTPEQLIAALRESGEVQGFSGLLATEISRARAGDRENLLRALQTWQLMEHHHAELERVKRDRQSQRPVLVASRDADQQKDLLSTLDHHLEVAVTKEQASLQRELTAEGTVLRYTEPEYLATLVFVGALLIVGFAPRIREYA